MKNQGQTCEKTHSRRPKSDTSLVSSFNNGQYAIHERRNKNIHRIFSRV